MTRLLLAVLLLFQSSPSRDSAQEPPEVQLRLKPGNSWVYKGEVEWAYASTPAEQARNAPPRVGKKQITWKTEIAEQVDRGDLKAFVVNGSFDNLPWYEPGQERSEQYLWIVYKNRFYSLALRDELPRRLRDPDDSLVSVVLHEEPVLQFPLELSQCTVAIEPEEKRQRDDMFYCWHLEEKREGKAHIPGAPSSWDVWTAWYRSNPDHQILGVAPGLGFVSYDFGHHGTVSEAHIKLVKAKLR